LVATSDRDGRDVRIRSQTRLTNVATYSSRHWTTPCCTDPAWKVSRCHLELREDRRVLPLRFDSTRLREEAEVPSCRFHLQCQINHRLVDCCATRSGNITHLHHVQSPSDSVSKGVDAVRQRSRSHRDRGNEAGPESETHVPASKWDRSPELSQTGSRSVGEVNTEVRALMRLGL